MNNKYISHERVGIEFLSIEIQDIFTFRFTYHDVISDIAIFRNGVDKRTVHRECNIESIESKCLSEQGIKYCLNGKELIE